MTIKRREFTTYAAAGFVAAGATYAGVLRPRRTPRPRTQKTPAPTSAPAPAPTPAPTSAPAPAPTPAPSPAPTPAPAPAPTTPSGLGYPFGARLAAYVAGTKPSQSNAAMDAVLTKQYDAWKAARIVDASSIVPGGYAVKFSNPAMMTVSEGMGYGMLLAVLFAGHDPDARKLFDGLLAVVRTRYAYGNAQYDPLGKYLMDWELYADGSSAGGGWNAVDGDLDVAMALLMADKQWGSSSGKWNYLEEGKNTVAAIKSICMKPDGTTKGLRTPDVSRTSDYMIGHFRAFAAATNDSFWNTAIDRAYQLADRMQTVYSAGVGLMPDFIVATNTTSPYPSPGYMGDGNANEDKYWWNGCRNPWRYSTDYVLSGDARWKTITSRIVNFFQKQGGADVTQIGTGYTLAGALVTGGNSPAYHGPLCAGACVDASYQAFVDALWNWNASHLTTGYYDGEIQLLSMVVASGNWWSPLGKSGAVSNSPAPAPSPAPGPAPSPAPAPGGANILANGDFSGGMSGWADWGNTAIVGGALQVNANVAGGAGQDIMGKLVAGKTYLLTATANITAAAEGVFVGVKVMDATGAALVNEAKLVSSTSPTAVSISFTAPAGAASGNVFVWKNANGAAGVIDNVVLVAVG
jgi:hypothetical protein